jgi:tRNA-Thr(GGU) m(6)t(6)A37 methyltransferase TsaA
MEVKKALDVAAEAVEGIAGISVRWLWAAGDEGPTFSLRLFEMEPGTSSPYHQHAHEHQVYVLSGQALLRGESQSYNLRAGDTALVLPHEEHQFTNTGDQTLRFLCAIPQLEHPVKITAQVSLYPLRQESLAPTIDRALDIFRRQGLSVMPGPMSTLISGDLTDVFKSLQRAFEKTALDGVDLVMTVTLSNACPAPEVEAADAISFRAIGRVENEFDEPVRADILRSSLSRIVIDPDLMPGLTLLSPGDRLLVVFHFHRSVGYQLLQYPRGDQSQPKRGVFALRSPNRPNPIGITEVELLEVDRNVLTVRGLDAIDGTPVLDLKPA